jgi:nucleotide-binding universal stress UspA family protein
MLLQASTRSLVMFENLVVPVDLSSTSLRVVPLAARMAAQVGGRVAVLTVVERPARVDQARAALADQIEQLGPQPVSIKQVVQADGSVVDSVARHLDDNPGSMVLMSSHGHGRSAALLGNTADALLRATFGPIIVVGPHAHDAAGDLGGTYVVPLDGSDRADGVLPIVAAWTHEFGGTPWLVEVVSDTLESSEDFNESSFVHRRAEQLGRTTHREVEFEVLHGRHAAGPIVDFARWRNASLVFMATHGRTGLERITAGSVTADVVREIGVPVVLFRPPHLTRSDRVVATATTRT